MTINSGWVSSKNLNVDLNSITKEEPRVTLRYKGEAVLEFKSSCVQYNRDQYPDDSFKQAAEKVYEGLWVHSYDFRTNKCITFEVPQWGPNPERKIFITPDGITHNYEVDTWHWWVLNSVEKLIKQRGL